MKTTTLSPQLLRKRKFFLVLPLLVLPFVTLLFWSLGGGKVSELRSGEQSVKGGLNTELPNAYLKEDQSLNKLSYYEKAASDSARLKELMKTDPYYLQQEAANTKGLFSNRDSLFPLKEGQQDISNRKPDLNFSPYSLHPYTDPNEAKVYRKLEELNTALNEASLQRDKAVPYSEASSAKGGTMSSTDIDRLERLMEMTKGGNSGDDPEMNQLSGMMEKILDIQHPERVKEKLKQTSEARKGQVLAVTAKVQSDYTSLLENKKDEEPGSETEPHRPSISNNGFYSLEESIADNTYEQNAIQAVIHETQTLSEGATVKLRLLNDIFINGTLVPKGSFVFGIASVNGERLNIRVNSVRYRNALFPVQLSVYDQDGMKGIYIPGAITRDVAKGSADRALQGINLGTLDPTVRGQAASAGIEAAKTLLSKKVKLVKVTLKAGYQVLLNDERLKASS